MAVEIPVYVDIQGAFDRAVQEIPKEMPKLEKVLSRYALNMKIDFGGGDMRTVRNLLTDTTMDAEELERALKKVRKAYDEAVAKGASKTKTSATVNNLAKAYGLLSQRVKGFYDSNAVAAMRLEDTIAKVTFKVKEMRAQLSTLAPGSDAYNKINYDLKLQQQRLAELTMQQMKYKAGIDASTSAYQKQSGVVKQLTGYFSGLYAAHSLVRFAKQVRDVTGELEYQRVALGHLLQDEAFGNELFAKTIEAAKESPFRIGQLVRYTKELAAYRIEQENLFDTTQRLADISAGLGVDMERLILAYGQVRAASVLRGQELRQFTEAGIPLVDLLAKKFRDLGREGTTTADVFKLISERAVPFEYIKQIFEELTDAGGMFYKMQETQAKTLQGRWEKLKDAYDQALMSVGETDTFQAMNDKVLGILTSLSKNLTSVVRIANAGSIAWAAYWLTMKSGISYGVKLTNMFIREYGVIKTLAMGVGGLTAAFKRLMIVLKSNWVGLALSAAAGLYTYFTQFKKKTEEATGELSVMQKAIEKMKLANERLRFESNIINSYRELSETTERTAVQSAQLESAIEELKIAYPELADKIGDANTPLSKQLGLLQEAADKSHELAVEEAKNRLDTQEQLIRGIEDEMKAAKQAKEIAEMRKREAEAAEKRGPAPFSQQYGPGTYDTAEDLKNKTIDAAKAAKEADSAYDEVAARLAEARREAEQLRKLVLPPDASKLEGWRALLADARKYMSEGVPKEIFTEKDIQGWDSLGEAIKKLKPQYDEAKKTYDGLVSAVKEGGKLVRPELEKDKEAAEDAFDAWKALDALLGGLLSKKTKTGSDTRLSNLKKDISEITNAYKKFLELRKYMSDSQALSEIGILFPQLKGWEPSFENTIEKLQEMRKKVVAQLAKSPNDKTLLEMQRALDTEISNLKFDDLKKKFDDELKRIKDEIKRSETAHNFYQDILGLTGDEQLAASMSVSVYGGIGQDFKDRIKKELVDSLNSLDKESLSGLDEAMRKAFETGDYKYLAKNIKKVPEELRATVQQVAADAERFSEDQIRTWIKELAQFKTYGEKRVQLAKQTAQEIEKINASGLPKDQKDSLILEYQRKEAEEAAKLQYEAFKDTPMYIHLFENLDAASTKMLTNMRDNLIRLKENWKDLDPTQLREMQKRIEEIDSQLAAKNPFKAIADGIRAYREQINGTSREEIERNAILDQDVANAQKEYLAVLTEQYEALEKSATATDEEKDAAKQAMEAQAVVADEAQKTANASAQTAKNLEGSLKSIIQGADNIEKWTSAFSSLGSSVKNLMSEVLSDEDAEAFAEQFDGVMGVIDGLSKSGGGISKILKGDLTGIIDIVSGAVDSLAAIFGASNAAKVRRANREIERQQKLIDNLERSYQRLEDAMDEAFGNDYMSNYAQQLHVINAEIEAYRAQAAAERSKGKKADEDKALEYERQAEEAMERIKEATKEMQSFFAGTDLASASQDFASAWLDAYQEFGDTAGAIEERMEEMVKNLVEKAALSGIVESILGPWYKSLKDVKEWDAATIASKMSEARGLAETLNNALLVQVSDLQSAGAQLRGTVGQFTGIKRDIANASEESISGLAAGVNTQNFFLQHIDANVAAIVLALTGESTMQAAKTTAESGSDPYKDAVLENLGALPQMRDDMAAIRLALDRVVKLNGDRYAVNVRM